MSSSSAQAIPFTQRDDCPQSSPTLFFALERQGASSASLSLAPWFSATDCAMKSRWPCGLAAQPFPGIRPAVACHRPGVSGAPVRRQSIRPSAPGFCLARNSRDHRKSTLHATLRGSGKKISASQGRHGIYIPGRRRHIVNNSLSIWRAASRPAFFRLRASPRHLKAIITARLHYCHKPHFQAFCLRYLLTPGRWPV